MAMQNAQLNYYIYRLIWCTLVGSLHFLLMHVFLFDDFSFLMLFPKALFWQHVSHEPALRERPDTPDTQGSGCEIY
jgi:hypothetical protein